MIAVLVGAAGFVTSGVVAGLGLLLGFPGVLSLILFFLPSRPKVAATLRGIENAELGMGESALIIAVQEAVRPLDIAQIVDAQEQEALKTMPRAPTPRVPRGAFGGAFDLNRSTADMISSVTGASDEELHAFIKKVRVYGEKLRAWLEQLDASRHECLREFTATARVCEAGQAPADFARLRLRFPDGFEEWEQPPEVPEPPERPKFVGRHSVVRPGVLAAQSLARGSLSRLIPRADEFKGTNAEYSQEDGATIISLNIGHINQHDHRDTAEFVLRSAPPGVYRVEWEISANGLTPPTNGTIAVEVLPPQGGEPIVELQDALAERERHALD